MQIINRFEQIVYKYDLCLFKFVSLTRLAVTLTAIMYVSVLSLTFFLLFTVCLYRYKYIWKNTWCCIILVSETKDWRLFELFVCLFKFCLFTVFVLFTSTRHTSSCCVSIAAVVVCLHSVYLYNYYLHKVLLIRFTGVYEWVSGMMRLCVYVFVLTDSTKKLNK